MCGTTYHFRAVAQSTSTAYGSDMTFTTSTGSLSVTTGSATDISATSATLNGALTCLGGASSVSVYFQYGTTTSYGSTTPMQSRSAASNFSAGISGLAPSTLYHFQAVAVGSTVYGSDVTFTTSAGSGGTSPPHQFYGYVYTGSGLAPAGTSVQAYVSGWPAASTTTASSGRYGYTTLFLVPGTAGGTVTFYVGGTPANETAIWSSGGITNLNLHSGGGGGVLTITCPQNTGTIGTSYSSSIGVSGGTSPYTCSITGSLPPGLTRTACTISGTPTTNGTYPFTVQATDSTSPANTGTQSCSITIGSTPPPPGTRLLGTGATGTITYTGSSHVRLFKFTASGDGNITQIQVYSLVGGNNKVALYSDSSGVPGALLNANNTSTACTGGQWTTISLPATPVVSGTAYWIGQADDGTGAACYSTVNPVTQYHQPIVYATYTFPASAGTGYDTNTGYYVAIAGYTN